MSQFIDDVHNLIIHKMEKGELHVESLEALKNVLEEYKIHIKGIEEELKRCKLDHRDLREEMNKLLIENRDLTTQLKAAKESEISLVASKLKTQDSELNAFSDHNVELLLEEKQMLERLWKESWSEVSVLENKLQDYQSGNELRKARSSIADLQKDYTEAIQILDSRCSSLRVENDQLSVKTQLLESQLNQVMSRMTSVSERNHALDTSLKEALAREQELKTKYLALEANFIELDRAYHADKIKYASVHKYEKSEEVLRDKLKEAERARDELQAALERCHEHVAELARSRAQDRARIEEAVAVSDAAQRSRDEALQREAACAEEVERLRKELTSLIEEAGVRVGQETAAVVKQFEGRLRELTSQLDVSHQDGLRKTAEVKQLQKECARLQELLNQRSTRVETNSRDKELDRLYRELHSTESECLQLRMDNESFEDGFKLLQEKCRRNSREKQRLREELRNAQQQLQNCQHELSMTSQRAELLNTQLYEANCKLAQVQRESVVLETAQDVISNPDVTVVSRTKVVELYRRMEDSYGQMNNKWKTEMSSLTERIEAKLKKTKSKQKFVPPKPGEDSTTNKKPSEDQLKN